LWSSAPLAVELAFSTDKILDWTVANGKDCGPALAELVLAEICHAPTKPAINEFGHFLALLCPVLRRPIGERQQMESLAAKERIGSPRDLVDFGLFQVSAS
jgi:hypothetical protein